MVEQRDSRLDRTSAGVPQRRRVHVWRWPLLLAVLTLFGLLSALLGQGGVWWCLSWITLAAPLIVIAKCLWRGSGRTVAPVPPA